MELKTSGEAGLDLEDLVHKGFNFLDSYLENALSGPTNASVRELLKTPGRKKDAPVRTRAAAAAEARAKSVIATSLEDTDTEAMNSAPVNSFHKALLQVQAQEEAAASSVPPRRKAVTIASSPSAINDEHGSTSTPLSPHSSPPPSATESSPEPHRDNSSPGNHAAITLDADNTPVDLSAPVKELSMIAEDDELERSHTSDHAPTPISEVSQLHVDSPRVNAVTQMDMEIDVQHEDVTSTSARTFDSIPLDSPPVASRASSDYFTAPLPRVQDDVSTAIPVVEASHDTAPQQTAELTVPIHDEDSPTGDTLVRKPSLSQLVGLTAPSPLHKSTHAPPEQSSGGTTGVVGGKRSSWLVKAREAKAMEFAGKRTSTLAPGLAVPGGSGGMKRKSGEMLGPPPAPLRVADDDERAQKVLKLTEPEEGSLDTQRKGKARDVDVDAVRPVPQTDSLTRDLTVPLQSEEEGVLDRFKKTVEGLGARAGKSMGKSLGGTAAAALAEARAAAEARVAERHLVDGSLVQAADAEPQAMSPSPPRKEERRLSVSDLISSAEKKKQSEFMLAQPSSTSIIDMSVSTTPPHSPPPPVRTTTFTAPVAPVFTKPPSTAPTVFAPPGPSAQPSRTVGAGPSRDFSFKLPMSQPFSFPAAMSLGVPASLGGMSSQPSALSAQTSKASLFSDAVFDREDDVPAWMPATQDTDYSIHPSQPNTQRDELDEDDSWHVDENFKSNQMWTPFGFGSADKDDTWSTLASRSTSQKGADTGPLQHTQNLTRMLSPSREAEEDEDPVPEEDEARTGPIPAAFALDANAEGGEPEEEDLADMAMEVDEDDDAQPDPGSDLDDLVAAGKSTVGLIKARTDSETRSQSQQSMASTASSSQSQQGFFGQASRLVSSVLGGSKKTKPEPVKSLQLAAAAAKKQQEEIDKKATRLKDMENRRQQAIQRKADEEAARALDEERKIKEDTERRKREREEHTDKRPLRSTVKKAEEDTTKKRKLAGEAEKKAESKKPLSKDKKDTLPVRSVKPSSSATPGTATKPVPPLRSALRQPGATTLSASTQDAAPSSAKPADGKQAKFVKPAASSSNLKAATTSKGKGKATAKDDDEMQGPNAGKSQIAQPKTPAPPPPPVTSESIELPDINSEYSDSDDEDRPRTFDPPEWAQSPELRQALQQQSTVNPDEIFGPIVPLRMEDIFRTRQSRFRARTSSANWTGTDQLTAEEERDYNRRMGFK